MSTLKRICTAVETIQRSWQDALTEVQLTMICTANRVTKFSPLELFIGKEARPFNLLPIDGEGDHKIDKENLRNRKNEKRV